MHYVTHFNKVSLVNVSEILVIGRFGTVNVLILVKQYYILTVLVVNSI